MIHPLIGGLDGHRQRALGKTQPAGAAAVRPGKGLEIRNALWGAMSTWKDVTEIVRDRVADGKLLITARNDELGGDPIFEVPKELRVEFSVDGKVDTRTVAENAPLKLP